MMKSSKDVRNLASYISVSSKTVISESGRKRFFIPFFREKVPELFNKSVVMSSVYLNVTSFSDPLAFNTDIGYIYSFKSNIVTNAIPEDNVKLDFGLHSNATMTYLVEHNTGINTTEITNQCAQVFKQMNIQNTNQLNQSFSTSEIQKIFEKNCIVKKDSPLFNNNGINNLSGSGGFISYGKI